MKNLDDLKDRNYEHARETFIKAAIEWHEAGAKEKEMISEIEVLAEDY